jgi:hypothetical protein
VVVTDKTNTDELTAFVASTLKAIAAGIEEAQGTQIASAHGTGTFGFRAPTEVEFDVAVSATTSEAGGGGMKVSVFGIGGNLDAKLGSESSTISRIRFSVPTTFKSNNSPDASPLPTANRW